MTTASLTPLDLVIAYAILFATFFLAILILAGGTYIAIRLPVDLDFKHDLRRKHDAKSKLPSGANQRLSFLYVLKLVVGDNCVQATLLYRLSHALAHRNLRLFAEAVHAFSKFLTHIDISPWAEVGRGLYLYHGLGTVIGKGSRIGARALICQGVTTGEGPLIGDDVKLWAGAKVIGKVSVGDRVEVGANAVVIRDIPADSLAAGVPARVLPKGRRRAGESPLLAAEVERLGASD
jgi:serine O-acetyltransferase